MQNRTQDLDLLAKNLDITPTMYTNAVNKYRAISDFLKTHGIQADFYPQGSFRLGTVTRPLVNGEEMDFDLDVICETTTPKDDSSAKTTKESIGRAIQSNETYRKLLLPEDNRCWTLEYAKVSADVGFKLDLVPAAHESILEIINQVQFVPYEYAKHAIVITEKTDNDYNWISSNPEGYAQWFENINSSFSNESRRIEKRAIYEQYTDIYASIADVPSNLTHSALQRVIQILKRHRDIFYHHSHAWELRPSSIIITTLVAQLTSQNNHDLSVDELLDYITSELTTYATLLTHASPAEFSAGIARTFIQKQTGNWQILNPINPNDNYADSWTDDTARMFFKWLKVVKEDFDPLNGSDPSTYYAGLQRGFGKSFVEKHLPHATSCIPVKQIHTGIKPWGGNRH